MMRRERSRRGESKWGRMWKRRGEVINVQGTICGRVGLKWESKGTWIAHAKDAKDAKVGKGGD